MNYVETPYTYILYIVQSFAFTRAGILKQLEPPSLLDIFE